MGDEEGIGTEDGESHDGDGHVEEVGKNHDGDDYIAPDGESTSSGDDDGYYDDDTKARAAKLAHRLSAEEVNKKSSRDKKKMLSDMLSKLGKIAIATKNESKITSKPPARETCVRRKNS